MNEIYRGRSRDYHLRRVNFTDPRRMLLLDSMAPEERTFISCRIVLVRIHDARAAMEGTELEWSFLREKRGLKRPVAGDNGLIGRVDK